MAAKIAVIVVNDEEILDTFAQLQEQLKKMSRQFDKLKDLTYELYRDNESLREENQELKDLIFSRQNSESKEEIRENGYSNLSHLYEEGYHICPYGFGEKREGNCLFCKHLLEKRFQKG